MRKMNLQLRVMESKADQNQEPGKVSEGRVVDTGDEVSANSCKFAEVLPEEQPGCSNVSEIALRRCLRFKMMR